MPDYFISASKSEGLPNTVLEALAVGVPVCLSDIDQHIEIIGKYPFSGELFRTNCVNDLRIKIDRLLINDYNKMSNSAIDLVNKKFNYKDMSKKYQDLYLRKT